MLELWVFIKENFEVINLLATVLLTLFIIWFKHDFNEKSKVADKRYALKYQACMDVLAIVDAKFSNMSWSNDGGNSQLLISKQDVDIETIRRCHSSLYLTCGGELVKKYNEIMFSEDLQDPTKELHKLRCLIAEELCFENVVSEDSKYTWCGYVPFAKNAVK